MSQVHYTLRLAGPADLPQLHQLLAGGYVHLHMDWWMLDDWLNYPGFMVAAAGERLAGLSLAACDDSPIAWWRALALEAGWQWDAFGALLQATLDGLQQEHASALTCMAWSDWLENALPRVGFGPLTQVITLRKDDRQAPAPKNMAGLAVRPATPADLPSVLAIDRAAFDPTWRYGQRGLERIWPHMDHAVLAELGGQAIGYACGNTGRSGGHIVRLAVQPAQQGRGIGSQLLAGLARSFFAAGTHSLTINTQIDNAVSQKLYKRFNFRPFGYPVIVWQRLI